MISKWWQSFVAVFQFGVLPTEAELRQQFPHKENCQSDRKFDQVQRLTDTAVNMFDSPVEYVSNLELITESEYVSGGGHWVSFGSFVTKHYLVCEHCKAKARFHG